MLLVLILAAQLAPPSCSTRAGCEGAVNAVIHAFDIDRDGRLSQSEWTAMGDGKLSDLPAPRDEIERLRREIADDFRLEDRNADGYLTGDEMLGARLAAFPCIDSDGDGIISGEERERITLCVPQAGRQPDRHEAIFSAAVLRSPLDRTESNARWLGFARGQPGEP